MATPCGGCCPCAAASSSSSTKPKPQPACAPAKKTYERPNIAAMAGYTPGEQPANMDRVVKLNTNENPYSPAEEVLSALRGIVPDSLRRYPPPDSAEFRAVAAGVHGLNPDQVIHTNGGDELLRLLVTTFVGPGEIIGYSEPSYTLYPVLAEIQDARIHKVPLNSDYSLPPDFASRMNAAGAKMTFVVNPHAPSGHLTPPAVLAKVASELTGLLVIDEAYVDFVDPELRHDTVALIKDHPNILLLRSFSKGYSLAGMRCGYGMGPTALIEPMVAKTKDSYNMDIASQVVSVASLRHREKAAQTWAKVRSERSRLSRELSQVGFSVFPSQSNFLLATVPGSFGGGAQATYEFLKQNGVLVRYFKQPGLEDKLRITVGTPEQNDTLLRQLRACSDQKRSKPN